MRRSIPLLVATVLWLVGPGCHSSKQPAATATSPGASHVAATTPAPSVADAGAMPAASASTAPTAASSAPELATLLGKRPDEPAVERFLEAQSSPREKTCVLGQCYLNLKQAGVSLALDQEGRVETIFLHSQGHEGYAEYRAALPHGLSFDDDHQDVVARLGKPTWTGGGQHRVPFGFVADWIKYGFPNHSVHVQFVPEGARTPRAGRIELVTLMTPSADPHR